MDDRKRKCSLLIYIATRYYDYQDDPLRHSVPIFMFPLYGNFNI